MFSGYRFAGAKTRQFASSIAAGVQKLTPANCEIRHAFRHGERLLPAANGGLSLQVMS
jgi:hypothetical protein